ncbi:MAG: phosphoribosylaminoimidazolesuccinocarboxamide synthase [Bacillota bacterium]
MLKAEQLYEGKAKRVYATDVENCYWISYKDDATAFNGLKKGTIGGKGSINNRMSAILFEMLERNGVPTHFVKLLSDTEMLVKQVKIVPLEVIVRNYTAGSMSKRLGVDEGIKIAAPILEFSYKDDELGDPLINDDHALFLQAATAAELETIKTLARKINQLLTDYMYEREIILVDFKLEFGKTVDGQIILADEISPDTCRLWDKTTKRKLDKDRFRRDLGDVEETYREVFDRVQTR